MLYLRARWVFMLYSKLRANAQHMHINYKSSKELILTTVLYQKSAVIIHVFQCHVCQYFTVIQLQVCSYKLSNNQS